MSNRPFRRLGTFALAVAVALLGSSCVFLQRASLSSSGAQVAEDSLVTDISADGRYVVFESGGVFDNLDTNNARDVFVRDSRMNTTTRVSKASAGSVLNGASYNGRISNDGTKVVYDTLGTNSLEGIGTDLNGVRDVMAWDANDPSVATTLSVVNCPGNCRTANALSHEPDISDDGNTIVWTTWASNQVVPDGNPGGDIIKRKFDGTLSIVSVTNTEQPANGPSFNPRVNSNGTIVVFASHANNLVSALDNNNAADIFLRSSSGQTRRVSEDTGGGPANSASYKPQISGVGLHIVYESLATDIVAGDTNGFQDVFLYDLWSDTTRRMSVADDGAQLTGVSESMDVSAVNQRALFRNGSKLWVRDNLNGRTDLVSTDENGAPANSSGGFISTDGLYVAFTTPAALVSGDTFDYRDVYVRAYPQPELASVSPSAPRGQTTAVTVTGTGFVDGSDVFSSVSANADVSWSNVVVVNDSTITANVTVKPGSSTGATTVHIQTPDGGPGPNSGALASCQCLTVS